ncbi:hypothetical protein GCM10010358_75930 [Streptomyces minutiscleroticus]|uniref:Enoyl reductase (ER) domain-containing protein n=1 Tax=Streptomyces minutiscleroticus TaxID=68238 RepID=A0A918U8Q1_9ACTN|nr:hypothetical protein GCM10010358_75930 [Streptomyces minutiscleroticus]
MRRVRFYAYGGPEVLRVEEAEAPEPGPGELLVRTEAVGVTLPAVRRVRGEGGRTPLPGTVGGEVAGTVVALGPDVAGFGVGDRVTSLTFSGSYAELVLAPAALASRVPDGASAVRAVTLVRSGHVALAALATALPASAGSVLVTGAASGVGHLAVQPARLRGAGRVVAAVGSSAKADFVRGLGADEVVTYDSESWGSRWTSSWTASAETSSPARSRRSPPAAGWCSSAQEAAPCPLTTSWRGRRPSPGSRRHGSRG